MSSRDIPSLQCQEISVSVPGRKLIDSLSLEIRAGEMIALLGQNGVGKSLLLHTLAGLRAADYGTTEICGKSANDWPPQSLARRCALLPQYTEDFFPTTVIDTVLVGRHPHIARWRWESADDREIARNALASVDLEDLTSRDVMTLSGGERRRLAVAQIIAQDPGIFLLDEPTNHLDPQHQIDVLKLFRQLADDGRVILVSLHDVNLATRFADRCLLLFGDGRWELGARDSVLNDAELSSLYGTNMDSVAWRDTRIFIAGS